MASSREPDYTHGEQLSDRAQEKHPVLTTATSAVMTPLLIHAGQVLGSRGSGKLIAHHVHSLGGAGRAIEAANSDKLVEQLNSQQSAHKTRPILFDPHIHVPGYLGGLPPKERSLVEALVPALEGGASVPRDSLDKHTPNYAQKLRAHAGTEVTPSIIGTKLHGYRSPAIVLHELGHATGTMSRSNAWRKATQISQMANITPLRYAGSSAISGLAQHARNEEDIENLRTARNVNTGVLAALAAPVLAEEARASIRAIGMARKRNIPIDKSLLAKLYGSYLATHAVPVGLAHLFTTNQIRARERSLEHAKNKDKARDNK